MEVNTDKALDPLRQILMEVGVCFPELAPQLDNSFNYVLSLCRTRGTLDVLMIQLPKVGKYLDKCLSSGCLDIASWPAILGRRRGESRILPGLFAKVFEYATAGEPVRVNPNADAIFFLRTFFYLYKKVEYDCPPAAVHTAVSEYVQIDEGLRPPTLKWNEDPTRFDASIEGKLSFASPDMHHALRRAMGTLDDVVRLLSSQVEAFDSSALVPRHGPGAVADMRTGGDKYSFPSWSRRLDHYFSYEYFAYSTEEWAYEDGKTPSNEEVPARLSAVPKTLDKPRLITIEPTAHQFIQQGLMKWIRRTLPNPLRLSIDFLDQEPSRALAREASISGDLVTVDLSSASDRLSCWTIERAFHNYGGILPYLYATRSRDVCIPADLNDAGAEKTVNLKKFAGMGSAVTFPVQSIVYACCAIAACIVESGFQATPRNIEYWAGQIRVFGDDIILPKPALAQLGLILGELQLKIN